MTEKLGNCKVNAIGWLAISEFVLVSSGGATDACEPPTASIQTVNHKYAICMHHMWEGCFWHPVILTLDPLSWNLAHRLLLPRQTFTQTFVIFSLFAFKLGAHRNRPRDRRTNGGMGT